jgi:hypothetical protein
MDASGVIVNTNTYVTLAEALRHRKTDGTQALAFPRTLIACGTPDDWQFVDAAYDDTVVPQVVKDAQCEEALALLRDDGSRRDLQAQGVSSITLGKMSETYVGRGHGLRSAEAREMLRSWIAGAVRIARPR